MKMQQHVSARETLISSGDSRVRVFLCLGFRAKDPVILKLSPNFVVVSTYSQKTGSNLELEADYLTSSKF